MSTKAIKLKGSVLINANLRFLRLTEVAVEKDFC
jgi:hypothetical protein